MPEPFMLMSMTTLEHEQIGSQMGFEQMPDIKQVEESIGYVVSPDEYESMKRRVPIRIAGTDYWIEKHPQY